jgi:hypothetical protein
MTDQGSILGDGEDLNENSDSDSDDDFKFKDSLVDPGFSKTPLIRTRLNRTPLFRTPLISTPLFRTPLIRASLMRTPRPERTATLMKNSFIYHPRSVVTPFTIRHFSNRNCASVSFLELHFKISNNVKLILKWFMDQN